MMTRIPKNKAPDIFNNSVENYLYGGQKVQEAIRTIVNEMISDHEKYSDPLLSMSVSTYLYKGKNKDRSNPSSYRKVSIGSMLNKLADCYMEDTIKTLIKTNQSDLQFGFTKGIDFKSCTVLRETAVRYNRMKNGTTLMCAADVSNAFSQKYSRSLSIILNSGEL